MRDALVAGLMLAHADGVRPLLLLFCDGSDNMSWASEQAVRDTAARLIFAAIPSRPRLSCAPPACRILCRYVSGLRQ